MVDWEYDIVDVPGLFITVQAVAHHGAWVGVNLNITIDGHKRRCAIDDTEVAKGLLMYIEAQQAKSLAAKMAKEIEEQHGRD